jgi:hypothetical protein
MLAGPPGNEQGRSLGGHAQIDCSPDSDTDRAIAQFQTEREALWHALAVQHQQRALILESLQSINSKLAALLDIAMRKGGLR